MSFNAKSVLGILAAVAVAALAVNLIFFDKGPQPPAFAPSANVVEVTDLNFEQEVLNSKLPVIINFNADWCAPCKQYKPVFHKLADQYAGKVKFVSIDVDKAPGVAAIFQLQAIPATLFLSEKNNVISAGGAEGALTEEQLKKLVDYCLTPDAKLLPLFEKKPIDDKSAAPKKDSDPQAIPNQKK